MSQKSLSQSNSMAKPTRPFGYIAFSKDGSVTSHIEVLPTDKAAQEAAVGEKLLALAGKELFPNQQVKFEQLPERDNDFRILADGKPTAVVECIEVVPQDYLAPAGAITSESIAGADGQLQYIDRDKLRNVLVKKINQKLSKHYAKPKDTEFWLLIWTTSGVPILGHYWEGGQLRYSEPTLEARKYLTENGAGPFDRILVTQLLTRPTAIWPAQGGNLLHSES